MSETCTTATNTPALSPAPDDIRDSKWTVGDFEVITADGVRFRVPSYCLFWASNIFRDAQKFQAHSGASTSTSTPYAVTLLDTEIETERIFSLFMKMIVEMPSDGLLSIQNPPSVADFKLCSALFAFLHKWACEPPIFAVFRANLEHLAKRTASHGLLVFVIGAYVQDNNLCSSALIHHCGSSFKFSPAKWPFWVWKYCPPFHAAALVRACSDAKNTRGHMAGLFKQNLEELKKECQSAESLCEDDEDE